MTSPVELPAGAILLERDWLSANNIVFVGKRSCAVVDTGYCTHSGLTAGLVSRALESRPLDFIFNTHLHSDHCGGNALLQAIYPSAQTFIPPGLAAFVEDWNPAELTYSPTGQSCPQFHFEGVLECGTEVLLGDELWEVHSAPGHDRHSVIFFHRHTRTLISADALWENGFGVVFDELEGLAAFGEVADTLDLIESLAPRLVIPGHGPVFTDVALALSVARRRLMVFTADPVRHATHAAKVLLKFKLLELQRVDLKTYLAWADQTAYFDLLHSRWFGSQSKSEWIAQVTADLVRSGAARRDGDWVLNA